MKDKNLLIKFDSNYADEFDLSGFVVMTDKEWEEHKAGVAKMFAAMPPPTTTEYGYVRHEEIEKYFGTNESIGWETMEAYLNSFEVKKLSDDEYATLKKLFGSYGKIKSGMVVMLEPEYFDEE